MESIKRPKSLTELVTEKLRELIVSGELQLGEQLSEARIAKELQVSRTPVREAFNRLEIEGLLSVVPQSGTFVFSLAPDELAQLCDARVTLETAALEAAFLSNKQALHHALTDCVREMENALAANDITAYLLLDTAFHQCFFDCCQNRFLNDAYQAFAQKMAAIRCRIGGLPDHLQKSYKEHVEMAQAVQSGTLEEVREHLLYHIDRREGSYWASATIGPKPPQG
ncbi:GntR family transcriptional regulator [Maritalea porphyrae]|uniref:Transcriptional regulator n=1 Tax=Maritalea porphyrae TaxID=880732 RepID=A0ABQ5UTW5_9HYPH|nr:GntR family transcriptional regulator [Maritalea porphyrae]GLQ18122.1 transcriptional regulator [Maritalea porphyrae]